MEQLILPRAIESVLWPAEMEVPAEEDVSSVAESISAIKTLLHPITIKEDGTLVAGRKRLLACRKLGFTEILCKIVPNDSTEEECKIIGIHENLKRHNLPWYEQVVMEKQLHDLRQQEHGIGKRGKKVGWSLRDTAKELEMSFGILSEDIHLAEAVLADPLLRKVQDKTVAKRVLSIAIKKAQQELVSGASINFETNVVHHGSSEVILKAYPDNQFDACITDPPWLVYKDKKLTRDDCTMKVFPEIFRVLKPNSFLYMFVSLDDFNDYIKYLPQLGFKVQKHQLIWIKEGVLSQGTRSWEYQRDHEPILLAVKGSPALTGSMLSSVLPCQVVHSSKLIHPNEKPAALISKIIGHCTFEGALILDPFAGSGVVPFAAREMERRFVAIERDLEFYTKIVERLKK